MAVSIVMGSVENTLQCWFQVVLAHTDKFLFAKWNQIMTLVQNNLNIAIFIASFFNHSKFIQVISFIENNLKLIKNYTITMDVKL